MINFWDQEVKTQGCTTPKLDLKTWRRRTAEASFSTPSVE